MISSCHHHGKPLAWSVSDNQKSSVSQFYSKWQYEDKLRKPGHTVAEAGAHVPVRVIIWICDIVDRIPITSIATGRTWQSVRIIPSVKSSSTGEMAGGISRIGWARKILVGLGCPKGIKTRPSNSLWNDMQNISAWDDGAFFLKQAVSVLLVMSARRILYLVIWMIYRRKKSYIESRQPALSGVHLKSCYQGSFSSKVDEQFTPAPP
jgi:hypothetical protein